MQVSTRVILSSAEGIARDRRDSTRPSPGIAALGEPPPPRSPETSLRQDVLQSRLLDLQAVLSRTQSEYTREQTRNTYLTKQPEAVSPALLFDGEPLFPELANGASAAGLVGATKDRMAILSRDMKGLQVEMENLLALGISDKLPKQINAAALLRSGGIKELDPERVARLTRG